MTTILRRKWLAPMLLWVVGGCSWGFQENSGEIPAMHKNLSRTVDLQTGVILGDLEQAQAAAEWLLSQQDQSSFPPSAKAFQDEMVEHASAISSADDIKTAAAHTGRIAATCGSCHQVTGGGPTFVVGTKSRAGDTQESLMIRHLWAADRMWEGLVGPSEEAWRAGASALAETQPILAEELRAAGSIQRLEGLLGEVNLLAQEALEVSDLAERADVYGRMLATCNRCHAPTGVPVTR